MYSLIELDYSSYIIDWHLHSYSKDSCWNYHKERNPEQHSCNKFCKVTRSPSPMIAFYSIGLRPKSLQSPSNVYMVLIFASFISYNFFTLHPAYPNHWFWILPSRTTAPRNFLFRLSGKPFSRCMSAHSTTPIRSLLNITSLDRPFKTTLYKIVPSITTHILSQYSNCFPQFS